MKKFTQLTKYIGEMKRGKGERLSVLFETDVYDFCDKNPQFDHLDYSETLKEKGINSLTPDLDFSTLDEKTVIALLIFANRAEHFSDGALNAFIKNGSILKCLERLAELDQ